jgi:hypothetical protein
VTCALNFVIGGSGQGCSSVSANCKKGFEGALLWLGDQNLFATNGKSFSAAHGNG